MKKNYFSSSGKPARSTLICTTVFLLLLIITKLNPSDASAQIWGPEGLNMPGYWNSWTNPPTNNLALASSTQVPNGRIVRIAGVIPRYQTIFRAAATGGDVVGGANIEWLFTSGPTTNPYANTWRATTVVMDSLQNYGFGGSGNNRITLQNGFWYTMNWEDQGYRATRAIFMGTSGEPVHITTVSSLGNQIADQPVAITINTDRAPSPEERLFVRYTTDNWATSTMVAVSMTATSGTATISGKPAGTTVSYYVLSSTVPNITAYHDLFTIRMNNNNGVNYSYSVIAAPPPPPSIHWANLQSPQSVTIQVGDSVMVYARVFADGITNPAGPGAGISAWIGYSNSNTDPSTWTNWMPATFNINVGNDDEFNAQIGAAITEAGTYYFAARFQLDAQSFVYGGFSTTGGGIWDGTTNVSGVLTVNAQVVVPPPPPPPPAPSITWANLQSPQSATLQVGDSVMVYARVFADGITNPAGPGAGISAWIGYSNSNTDPSTWTNWVPATFNPIEGNNDEFVAQIGAAITVAGTYYFAARFQLDAQSFVYGGFSTTGGGLWNGTSNVSGVLTVNAQVVVPPPPPPPPAPSINWANLQWPPSDTIQVGESVMVYARVYAEGITNPAGPGAGISAWIGYSNSNTDPSTWTNWVPATFNINVGNDDEFNAQIGAAITEAGTYYFAARFQLDAQSFVYGGFSTTGGGIWDGTTNVSGVLTITEIPTAVISPNLSHIRIYPNPTTNWVILEAQGPFQIIVTDLTGKKVLSDQTSGNSLQIDLSTLPRGVYLIRLSTENASEVRRIIKN